LRIIEGFETAKLALSRQAPAREPGLDEREPVVRQIIDNVRDRGDAALFDYTLQFDKAKLTSLEVPREQAKSAYRQVDGGLVSALKLAAERIRAFHEAQKESIWHETARPGLRQAIRPLERVGVYVPGGTASYPSTVLMTAIPARVAGVSQIILVTPPRSDGKVSPLTLIATDIAQVDRIFSIGGAQAIAALAFGTESVPKVDKVCGPGNVFVMLAKTGLWSGRYRWLAGAKRGPDYCR
jgi:histidinol dehydrogenase